MTQPLALPQVEYQTRSFRPPPVPAMRSPKPLNLHDDIPILIYNDEAEETAGIDMTWYNDPDAGGFLVEFGVKNRLKKLNEVDYSWLEWARRTFQPNTKVFLTFFSDS
jgi:hypothetical protein